MLTAARIQKLKDTLIPIMDERLEKLLELAKMAKLSALIKENNTSNFGSAYKSLLNYVLEIEKK